MKNETRQCQNCKKDFIIESEDFNFYEKIKVPAPEKCPQCRQQLRMLCRNFKTLYKRSSDKSGSSIVSMYHSNTPFPVYDIHEWWSEDWDGLTYGREIDWDESFFGQLLSLFNVVPHMSIMNTRSINCEYSNMVLDSKNCYLNFGCLDNEDCDYGHIVWNSKDSIDNLYIFKCESCYECVDCLGCNKLIYSQECESCAESLGLFDCKGCFNCIGCVNLINKSYCIFNKQLSKEKYHEFIEANPVYNRENIKKIISKRDELREELPQRAFFGSRNNNVSGNHVYSAHNIHYSFDIKSGENSKFCFTIRKAMDTYDASFSADLSECYQVLNSGGSNKLICTHNVIDSHDAYCSDSCYNCDHVFGCFGLRKKSYCILNKQYTREAYEKLLPKIIELMISKNEWGLFFPKELSPFAYNESIVNEYMPLNKVEALDCGFRWWDDIPSTSGKGTISLENLPKVPLMYNNELMKEVLTCQKCQRNYKLINREIGFYKKLNLAIPLICFNCRHEDRMKLRNQRNLWGAICPKCNTSITTSYKPEDQKIYKLYCEKCYQQEVY